MARDPALTAPAVSDQAPKAKPPPPFREAAALFLFGLPASGLLEAESWPSAFRV
jgi:hypothetical protein